MKRRTSEAVKLPLCWFCFPLRNPTWPDIVRFKNLRFKTNSQVNWPGGKDYIKLSPNAFTWVLSKQLVSQWMLDSVNAAGKAKVWPSLKHTSNHLCTLRPGSASRCPKGRKSWHMNVSVGFPSVFQVALWLYLTAGMISWPQLTFIWYLGYKHGKCLASKSWYIRKSSCCC